MKRNEKGIALISVIILSLLALLLIAGLTYYLLFSKRVSTYEKRYTTALEAAKGGSEIIISKILEGNLKCTNSSQNAFNNSGCGQNSCNTSGNQYICLETYKCLGGDLTQDCKGGYRIDAVLLSIYSQGAITFYSIEVNSTSGDNLAEKATIQFVYKLE